MVTTREMAIARTVIYASLFDYPLTLEQLHHSLIERARAPHQQDLAVPEDHRTDRKLGMGGCRQWHDPEKLALGLDPRVGPGFRRRSCPIDQRGSNSTQSNETRRHQWVMM